MKKLSSLLLRVIAICALLLPISAKAQIIPLYAFSQTTNTSYDTLTGPQVVASGLNLDNQTYPVTLPFTFNFNNTNYNSIYVAVNGFVSFGSTDPGGSFYMINSNVTGFELFSGFDANLGSRGDSTKLSYKTTGIAPNRTFTIEWRNFGYSANPALSVNFQIQLSETTGAISVQYGQVALTGSSNLSVQVGLRGLTNSTFKNRASSNSNWLTTTNGASSSSSIAYTSYQNPQSGLKYTFTPPANCTAPAQPTALTITPSLTSASVSYTASSPAASGYLIVRTNDSVPLNTLPQNQVNYVTGNVMGNGTVVYNGTSTNFNNSGLTQNTSYTYTIFPYNNTGCYYAPVYNTISPLTASTQTLGPGTYYWNSTAASADFQVPGNWIPARNHTDAQDTLIFNNGATAALSNIPAVVNVNKLVIGNNSNISFSSNNVATLTTKVLFQLDAGSTLTLGGGYVFKLAFNSTGIAAASNINGNLNLTGSALYDARYSNTLINGTVNVTGANAEFNTTCVSNCTTQFLFGANSKYYHNRNGGKIPSASFDPSATVFVSGTTSVGPTMTVLTSQNQMLGNLVVDCPNATVNMNLISTAFNFNNVSIINPGSGIFTITANSIVNGNLNIKKGTFSAVTLSVLGDAVIDSATVNSGTYFLSGALTILPMATFKASFSLVGNTHQTVTVNGTFVTTFNTTITLSNPSGATLTGIIPINAGKVIVTSGKWNGTGHFTYSGSTSLKYSGALNLYTSAVEWPQSGTTPSKITIAQTGSAPNNRVYLQETHTIPQAFNLTSGILVLGDYDVNYIDDVYFFEDYTSSNSFLATNGSGKINMTFPPGQNIKIFPLGDIDGANESSPVKLTFNNTTATPRLIGARAKDAKYANITDTANCLSRYWSFTDDGNTPMDYSIQFAFKPADKHGNLLSLLQKWDGITWTSYPINAAIGDTTFILNNQTINSLNNVTFTAFALSQTASQVYTWTGATGNDYQVAANWTPNRNTPANTDLLLFNNGIADTVVNVPTQMITRLSILNNTTVNFAGSAVNAINELGIISDNDSTTNELSVAQGCALRFLNGNGVRIKFLANGSSVNIAGAVDLFSTGSLNFTNTKSIITNTGTFAAGNNMNSSTSGTITPFYSTKDNLEIKGSYYNNYFGEGFVPLATWADGSNVYILNNKTTQAAAVLNQPVGFGQRFYNLIYNCPSQQNTVTWGTSVSPDSIRGTLTILSTGTGNIRVGSINAGGSIFVNKLKMSGGVINFSCNLNIPDSFINAGGSVNFIDDSRNLNFIGTTSRQYVQCFNTSMGGWVTYNILNPYGIRLVGTGNFNVNPNFNLNSNGGLKIGTPVLYPVMTDLKLVYNVLSSCKLEYNGDAYMADSIAFPELNGPTNVTINLANSSAAVTVPFNRTIRSYLYLTKGDIDFGANSLMIGISAADNFQTYGQIGGTGRIRLTTGTLTRWVHTTAGISGTDQMTFPIAYGTKNRTAALSFGSTSSTNVPTGGTLTIAHANVPGMLTGLNVNDGTFNISNRFNSSWKLTPGNGLAMNGNMALTLYCQDLGVFNNLSHLRVMWPFTTIGTNTTTGAAAAASRSGLTLSTLTDSSFYIGTDSANVITDTSFISINSGNWDNPATWNNNAVPTGSSRVFISPYDTVTIQNNAAANDVIINALGVLRVAGGVSIVDDSLTTYGTFILDGGNFTSRHAITTGSFNISGGKYTIAYGGFNNITNSTFNQSGGAIVVRSGIAAPGFFISSAATSTGTGGTIQLADPASFYGGGFSAGHTLIFGDSISTSTLNFALQTYGKPLGSVIVYGTPSVSTGRAVVLGTGYPFSMKGNLTLKNKNAKWNINGASLAIEGNLTLDTNTQVIASGSLSFSGSGPQLVSGKGKFYNADPVTSSPYADFRSIAIENSSAEGVTFDIGDFNIEYKLSLLAGKLNLNEATLTVLAQVAPLTQVANSWVNGRYRGYVSATANRISDFPVGDSMGPQKMSIQNSSWNGIVSGGFVMARIIDGDHPSIGSSAFNPNKTVNRQYVIDTTNSQGFVTGSGQIAATFSYTGIDIDPNVNPLDLSVARFKNAAWSYFSTDSIAITGVTASVPANKFQGIFQVGVADSSPVFTLQPQSTQVCTGLNAQFSVAANANAYAWQVNTGSSWSDILSGNVYTGTSSNTLSISQPPVSMNGYLYRCIAYNFEDSVISNVATLTVGGTVIPTINIAATPGTGICAGQPATFNAIITNGGTTPQYQWKINGIVVGNNSSSYTSATISNNDTVSCMLTSGLSCASPAAVGSNAIVMTVTTPTPVTASISGSAVNNTICSGASVTFTATVTNGGSNPVYHWRRNGSNTGTNSATFQTTAFNNNDQVSCIVTGSDCSASSTDTSNIITVTVLPVVNPAISISTSSTTICPAQNITFTATGSNGGSSPVYQWKINGNNVGTNASTFAPAGINNGDIVTCILTSNAPCASSNTASSNALTITVTPTVTPTIAITAGNNNICSGSNITFTAVITNGGNNPAYQWKVNGANAGTNSNTYSSATLNNNDIVTCVLTSNANCAAVTSANSNAITMVVMPLQTPTVAIIADSASSCAGSTVTFTATSTLPGNSPVYQWKVNNVNVGTNSPAYSSATLNNGDIVKCVMTSNATGCLTSNQATSNTIAIIKNNYVTPAVSITASGNNICQGSSVTFTAASTNGGTAPAYQWYVNNTPAGTNAATYSTTSLNNGDQVKCKLYNKPRSTK
jgi:hypothetical protein